MLPLRKIHLNNLNYLVNITNLKYILFHTYLNSLDYITTFSQKKQVF